MMHGTATPTVLIAGVSSGIGTHLAERYRNAGAHVIGTSRAGHEDIPLDINSTHDVQRLASELAAQQVRWDLLIVSVGVLEPITPFLSSDFNAWENAYRTNCVAQWELLHALHPLRTTGATVIFFAGGAVNGVLESYSSYAVAKIGLIKMAEYLQTEDSLSTYAVLGPGWVATKIHEQTLRAGATAGANFERTRAFTTSRTGTSLDEIYECIEWIRAQPVSIVGGRNFSVVHDAWGSRPGNTQLTHALAHDRDAYTLRRRVPQATSPVASIARIFDIISVTSAQHARDSALYGLLSDTLRPAIEALFSTVQAQDVPFGPFGDLRFPYARMGAVDTLDLFGLDELLIFAFYWNNRHRYRHAADIGANLGLHSIIMSRCGMRVQAFEPDPQHADRLQANLDRNGVTTVDVIREGVSDRAGTASFIRVLGNTTSSHIAGSKQPYGDLEHFEITLHDIREIARSVDFLKIDAEGHETTILAALTAEHWMTCDAMVEIGTAENAHNVYAYLRRLPVHCFSQKRGWARVASLDDMPTSYREGSLFITNEMHTEMPWSTQPHDIKGQHYDLV